MNVLLVTLLLTSFFGVHSLKCYSFVTTTNQKPTSQELYLDCDYYCAKITNSKATDTFPEGTVYTCGDDYCVKPGHNTELGVDAYCCDQSFCNSSRRKLVFVTILFSITHFFL